VLISAKMRKWPGEKFQDAHPLDEFLSELKAEVIGVTDRLFEKKSAGLLKIAARARGIPQTENESHSETFPSVPKKTIGRRLRPMFIAIE